MPKALCTIIGRTRHKKKSTQPVLSSRTSSIRGLPRDRRIAAHAKPFGRFCFVCRHTSFRSLGRVVRRVMSRIFDGFGKLRFAGHAGQLIESRPTTVVWDECVTSSHYSDLHRADRRPLARRRDASHTSCVKATGFYTSAPATRRAERQKGGSVIHPWPRTPERGRGLDFRRDVSSSRRRARRVTP